ncbi:hypothetical protein [uncultured Methanofollis sp.]|uniref:hypothetical protein n=1 Tax=uncultured Methanofollis sp. TaxID=262500 RepID=UPI002608F106|nr:hypothetical protein [uncultured Methanofollis sp.]
MEIGRICTIAEKEFAENIRGRHFLLVLALFLVPVGFFGLAYKITEISWVVDARTSASREIIS